MADNGLSKVIKETFNKEGAATAAMVKRTRIDARTVGYPLAEDSSRIEWMGMTPVGDKGDQWLVIHAKEELNRILSQVNEGERIVEIAKVIGSGEKDMPFTFAEATERLAVWEFKQLLGGATPALGQDIDDIGINHFKNSLMRRGYVASTTGKIVDVQDIFPADSGKFLKSDLDRMKIYRGELTGDAALDEIIKTHEPLYITETSIEDDVASFGQIGLFDQMQTFVDVLVNYAKVKLAYVEDFIANPSKKQAESMKDMLNSSGFFGQDLADKMNALKIDLTPGIFRFYHVSKDDWDKELDFNDKQFRIQMLKEPGAQATLQYLGHKISFPMVEDDVDSMLFTSARSLVYFREMLKDSAEKDILERKDIFKQADVDDLLNFLDLLEIKYQYANLARSAITLKGSAKDKDLQIEKDAFEQKVSNLKRNLKESRDFSPAQERQIDDFIKAKAPIYLLERLEALPARITAARDFIADRVLPDTYQMTLDLDYSNCSLRKAASPTRTSPNNSKPQL